MKNNYKIFGLLSVLCWSSSYGFTKIALNSLAPLSLGSIRYVIAAIILCTIGAIKRIGLPEKKDIPGFLLAGFFGFVLYMVSYNIGSSLTPASVTSSVASISPITTGVLAAIFFKEKQSLLCWAAVVMEFAGIIILNFNGGFRLNIGVLLIVLASLFFSCYNLLLRKYSGKYSSLQIATYSLTGGAVFLLLLMPRAIPDIISAPLNAVLSTVFISVFPSALAYLFWSRTVSLSPSSGAATNFLFLTPIFSLAFNYILVRDVPSVLTIIGLVVVLIGLFLYNYFSHHPNFGHIHLHKRSSKHVQFPAH